MTAVVFEPIRDARQRQHMLDLLVEGFPHVDVDWSAAFKAPQGRHGHGLLLTIDGAPQGGLLTFESTQIIGGRERSIINVSSWTIRPKYRNLAVRMARAATSDPNTIYTVGSPIRSVQSICLRVGFRYLSRGSIASVPLLNGITVAGDIHIEPFAVEHATPEWQRWLANHSDDRHVAMTIQQGARMAPALWLRGLKVKGLPAARLLFAADYGPLRAALPAIHGHMLRRHGIVGLYLPRIGPLQDLRSLRKPHSGPSIVVKGDVADTDVNLLYSELLYLRM